MLAYIINYLLIQNHFVFIIFVHFSDYWLVYLMKYIKGIDKIQFL